jgi:uncharacterized protein
MPSDLFSLAVIIAILLLGGFTKGVIGFGLPSIGMGFLSLLMPPTQAAALLLLPNLATNIIQSFPMATLGPLLKRLAPLLLGTLAGIAVTEWLSGGREFRFAVRLLGATLVIYALLGLFSVRFSLAPERQGPIGWAAGLATGCMTALTGVYVIPAGPYLSALGLTKDELVQSLGLAFLTASAGLGIALWTRGAVFPTAAGTSAMALAPVLVALLAGQFVRGRIPEQTFRRFFFMGMLALGLWLAIRG